MSCAREVPQEEDWLDLADCFGSAAALGSGWSSALTRFAAACGASAAQIAGVSTHQGLAFNWVAGQLPALLEAQAAGSSASMDQAMPWLRRALSAPVLKLLAQEDEVLGVARGLQRADTSGECAIFSCQTPLIKDDSLVIVLSILRSTQQGPFTASERTSFITMAPHVRAAVQMQMVLEGHDMDLLSGAMEALSLAAFICDRSGIVRAMTGAARALLEQGQALKLAQGQFQAQMPADTEALRTAVRRAAVERLEPGSPRIQSIILRNGCGPTALPLVLDVISLPRREYEFSSAPRVLVVVRGSRKAAADRAFLLHAAFGLTAAEAEVALLLAEGQSVETIALRRCVSESTVRSQVKNVFSKLGVNRQIELAARLAELR